MLLTSAEFDNDPPYAHGNLTLLHAGSSGGNRTGIRRSSSVSNVGSKEEEEEEGEDRDDDGANGDGDITNKKASLLR
jgi:hypothetical protein